MKLFNKFDEAIILKENSSLEKQLEELNEIKDLVDDKDKINREISNLNKGINGEKDIIYKLRYSNVGMFVLRDITLKYNDLTAQIDFLILTEGYIYVVECKNLYGNIFIDYNGAFKRKKDNNYIPMDSPYEQAIRHKELIKKLWKSRTNQLMTKLQEKYFDEKWYKPLVVFSNNNCTINTNKAPKEIKEKIVRSEQLVHYIEEDLKHYNKSFLDKKDNLEKIANRFKNDSINEYHSFADKYKQNIIKKKLILYREEKAKKRNIPTDYVFTDDELKQIIELGIKTLDELKNILTDIKIKYHGEEIVNIINSL